MTSTHAVCVYGAHRIYSGRKDILSQYVISLVKEWRPHVEIPTTATHICNAHRNEMTRFLRSQDITSPPPPPPPPPPLVRPSFSSAVSPAPPSAPTATSVPAVVLPPLHSDVPTLPPIPIPIPIPAPTTTSVPAVVQSSLHSATPPPTSSLSITPPFLTTGHLSTDYKSQPTSPFLFPSPATSFAHSDMSLANSLPVNCEFVSNSHCPCCSAPSSHFQFPSQMFPFQSSSSSSFRFPSTVSSHANEEEHISKDDYEYKSLITNNAATLLHSLPPRSGTRLPLVSFLSNGANASQKQRFQEETGVSASLISNSHKPVYVKALADSEGPLFKIQNTESSEERESQQDPEEVGAFLDWYRFVNPVGSGMKSNINMFGSIGLLNLLYIGRYDIL